MDGLHLARALLMPVQLAAVATSARSFAGNPILGSERLNRWGLHARRVALAQRLAAHRRDRLADLISEEDRATFARDGILVKRDVLPPGSFARLKAEIEALRAPAREVTQGNALTRLIPLTPGVQAALPETRALLASPAWQAPLDYVASTRVGPLLFIQTIISHATPGAPDPQTELHSDTFYPSMKAWLYLQDVPAEDGPFVYVPGSHRATQRRLWWERASSLAWREGDAHSRRGSLRVSEAMLERLGYGAPVTYAVPANTLLIADTYGFHARGPSLRPSTRVSLWAQARRNPFLPFTGGSLTRPRWVRDRQAAFFWQLTDGLARLGLARQPWHDVGHRRPGDPPGAGRAA
ncbi:phytanoyl-CoA dioxygenase family protein [Roseomonas sp. E05]|uniref:phytanoyl-CoA dioxygenase family protein n=1 Tax=Roseomonas sp. E05 TaxID=3046310 RepID=UPI0024B98708|nr:phytanoyl-CoA dioxygenase family protein [Roseomonas sp. E05]MDJ0389354.1 phytanoyl-CoA dioxygenase family protein [Roseomonas sp. E05]